MEFEQIKERQGFVVHRESRTDKYVIRKSKEHRKCKECRLVIYAKEPHITQIKNGYPKYRYHAACTEFFK